MPDVSKFRLAGNPQEYQFNDADAEERISDLQEELPAKATINDTATSSTATWSSQKIAEEIAGATATVQSFSKTVTISTARTTSLSDERFTADHHLTGFQFYDSSNNPTGSILADISLTTTAGSCSVTISNVSSTGSVVLTFTYAP